MNGVKILLPVNIWIPHSLCKKTTMIIFYNAGVAGRSVGGSGCWWQLWGGSCNSGRLWTSCQSPMQRYPARRRKVRLLSKLSSLYTQHDEMWWKDFYWATCKIETVHFCNLRIISLHYFFSVTSTGFLPLFFFSCLFQLRYYRICLIHFVMDNGNSRDFHKFVRGWNPCVSKYWYNSSREIGKKWSAVEIISFLFTFEPEISELDWVSNEQSM